MKVTIHYDNGSTRDVEILDAKLLEIAQAQADTDDMIAREKLKPRPTTISAKIAP